MAFTYNDLVDEIKTRGMVPTGQNTFTTARFLAAINSVMRSKILPMVLKVREDYYAYTQSFSISSDGSYNIPTRAIGAKIDTFTLTNGTELLSVPLIAPKALQDSNVPLINTVCGFYIARNTAYLVPKEALGYSGVDMVYFLRPPEVVENVDGAQITAIDTATKTVTFDSGTIPTDWDTSDLFEIVQAEPHFDTLTFEASISAITTTTMVFSDDLPSRLAVGDWVCLNGKSPVIQCPVELQPLLAQEVANYCLRGQGDVEAYNAGVAEAKALREDLMDIISPRVEREGSKLVNRTGILRRGS